MRLIDADVLKQHIDKLPALPDGNFAGNHSALKALINMQPTIEPSTNCSEFPNNLDTISRAKAIEALDKRFDSIPMEQTSEILMLRKDLRELPPAQQPMPSNTSNALEALDSVNATQSNALGEQTKWNRMMLHLADLQLTYSPDWGTNGQGDQKLYDFVTELIDEFNGWDVTDTNVGEMITKKQMIDVLERTKRIANDVLCDGPVLMSYNDVLDSLINIVNFLPSAQPEKRTEERTETHGVCLDAISRQAAIELCDWYDNPSMREDLEKLRPVRFSADTISRKAVTDAIENAISSVAEKMLVATNGFTTRRH